MFRTDVLGVATMGSLVEDRTEQLQYGFWRKLVPRKSGTTAGVVDVYVFTPDGIKLR
jgi:Methyl-CpG binding domain